MASEALEYVFAAFVAARTLRASLENVRQVTAPWRGRLEFPAVFSGIESRLTGSLPFLERMALAVGQARPSVTPELKNQLLSCLRQCRRKLVSPLAFVVCEFKPNSRQTESRCNVNPSSRRKMRRRDQGQNQDERSGQSEQSHRVEPNLTGRVWTSQRCYPEKGSIATSGLRRLALRVPHH